MTEARRERIGRYVVLAELGRGAMGVVYRAHDPHLDRQVAIKTVRRDLGLAPEEDAELRKRVHQEATAAGRLTHPNIVAIHDVIELDELPYIVMEYVEGRTLAELIAKGPPPPSQAVRLVTEVCSGLEYAHSHGVIHRDIKPSNILVTASGAAKVSDFGIARVAGSHVTRTGAILGTPAYMAPEQLRGRALDGRSDIFALGVTLYEALTGVAPFQGDDVVAVLYQIAHEAPAPLSERNPAVPRALEPVTERAMAKDPEARYATARGFAEALTQAMTARAAPAQPARSRGVKSESPARRRRGRTLLVTMACLAIVGAGGWAAWGRRAPDRPVVAARPEPPVAEPAGPAAPTPSPFPAFPSPAAPAEPAAATYPFEADEPASTAIVSAPPTEVPAPLPVPVEEPPPASGPPAEPPPAPRPPVPAGRRPTRPTPVLGSIRVVTDPSVDVLLDDEYRGRTEGRPLVVSRVSPGERMVTLRLDSREHTVFVGVNGGQTVTVTHHFPPEPQTSVEKVREALEKKPREALDKLREGVEKAQREAVGALRGILEKVDGDRGRQGRVRGRE